MTNYFTDDMIYEIFLKLDLKSLSNCSLVNKQFNEISKNKRIWQNLIDFYNQSDELDDIYKSILIHIHIIELYIQ